MLLDSRPNLVRPALQYFASYHDHQVPVRQPVLRLAKTLPKQSLQSVAHDRSGYLLARDGETEPGALARLFTDEDGNTGIGAPGIVFEYLLIFGGSRKSQPSRKRFAATRTHFYGVSRALPLARRALITPRPPRVCMRARKPCVLARFNLLG